MSQTRVINGPHIRTERTTRSVMMHVSISLIPALLGAIYFFGIRALYLAGLSITVCVLTEYIWQKVTRKQVTAGDFSAVVTGLLLVLNMPVTVPIWTLVAADVFSILVVKQMFGGIGNNFVNPALMGRLLTMVAWPWGCYAVCCAKNFGGRCRVSGYGSGCSKNRWRAGL